MILDLHHRRRLLLALSICTLFTSACADTFKRIDIEPTATERDDVFVGRGSLVELEFVNDKHDGPVEVFPEPPLKIKRQSSQCEINSGIWVRRSVYLSSDEQILLIQEYSGSNDQLALYDTVTCRKVGELDVSGSRWWVSGQQVLVGRDCRGDDIASCAVRQRYLLDAKTRQLKKMATKP